ncbi:MAG: HlyC/CorC family transporter [Planctomycetes bacterium]|nr:HlyC/CorC family transporter [Planctomycetota bacterium]
MNIDIPMLALLPVLLALSGFFSGSETALFGLTEPERMALRARGSFASRAVEALLAHPRMLLITILLGNMTVNVLYFVITSVLLIKANVGVLGSVALAGIFLFLIILLGEVTPKLLANSLRGGSAALVAPPLLTVHRLIGPLRVIVDRVIVAPLSRLTAPRQAPPRLDREELAALVAASERAGVIDYDEQRILTDVLSLSQRKVREVMTPRVRMAALPATATRADVIACVSRTHDTNLPIYDGDLDTIVGMLQVKRYLLAEDERPLAAFTVEPRYVPEVAALDQLLTHFRDTATEVAIVVDEFGGTAGVVALEDVVEEIVGDIARQKEGEHPDPMLIGPARWRVSGDLSVHEWAEAFGLQPSSPAVSTLGGLIVARLGRVPSVGDTTELGNLRLEVEQVDRSRVVFVTVTLIESPDADRGEEGP